MKAKEAIDIRHVQSKDGLLGIRSSHDDGSGEAQLKAYTICAHSDLQELTQTETTYQKMLPVLLDPRYSRLCSL